jgi:hypothetical protein
MDRPHRRNSYSIRLVDLPIYRRLTSRWAVLQPRYFDNLQLCTILLPLLTLEHPRRVAQFHYTTYQSYAFLRPPEQEL